MIDRAAIQPNMEVLASDGTLVGRVGNLEGESLRLSGADSPVGRRHLIPLTWVARVDRHVHLSVGAAEVMEGGTVGTSIPPGTGAAGALGAGGALGLGVGETEAATPSPPSAATGQEGANQPPSLPPVRNPAVEGARPRRNYYLPWVLGLLLLLLLLFVALRSCDERDDDERERGPAITRVADEDRDRRREDGRYASGTIAYELDRFLASDEPAPRTLIFDRLNFDTGSSSVREADVADLDQIAQVLNAHPRTRIAIIGYTDARGSGRSNARLGRERADAVVDALINRGIAPARLEGRSGGEQEPVRSNRREEGRAENRRTELIVLSR